MKFALQDLGSVCLSSAVQGWTTCPHLLLLLAVVKALIQTAASMEQLTLLTVRDIGATLHISLNYSEINTVKTNSSVIFSRASFPKS